ncbi:MAG TPA: HAMP domain-containing sensor histidine kinase, partial [Nitrososphaeraceae archaeon]|nr:HAMP domain-containing sensor histidine kinase [Nitrososphaeraceae archaeon]
DNISYCNELSSIAEIRHLNGIKGNFEVSQKTTGKGEYIGAATLEEAEPVAQLIYSNVKEIVEQQQFVFDTLWNKAIPSQVRIKEIEERIKPETIEVIVDPRNALETEYRLLKSAKKEIQMIFSTVNTFHMQERQLGITKILTNLSRQGVSIKVLTPIDNQVKELIADLKEQGEVKKLQKQLNQKYNGDNDNDDNSANSIIDIQDIAPSSSINTKIIVVDKQDSLAMEIKDGMADSLHTTIGLSTLSNSKSTIASYSAIFENLTQQNRLYKQLKEAYQTVETTNAIRQEFINVAAHELRTPIQPILGYAELLLEEETDDSKKQALMGIVHNSERLQKLASDILDVARMDSNTFRLYKELVNLNYVISNIVKDYVKRQERQKASDITRSISSVNGNNNNKDNDNDKNSNKSETKLLFESKVKEDIFVEADKERLTQVICNILDNAFKFTEGHGKIIQITLEKQGQQQELLGEQRLQQEHHAIVSVKDTGTGIDPEISPRLFSKFATKSQRGTGLGLYISKNIVEAHGGRLYASNNNNNNPNDKGATFTIILPLFRQK